MDENELKTQSEEEILTEKEEKELKRLKKKLVRLLILFLVLVLLFLISLKDIEKWVCTSRKPVIYLYPVSPTEVSVKLDFDGELTTTYPSYEDGWKVTAEPDGLLTDANGMTYNYLYWEGNYSNSYDMTRGFCVKGSETAVFLEKALAELGLTRKEANEFIVYWLPMMEKNKYNIISFQKESYTEHARLDIEPAPDTVIRVFMTWYESKKPVKLEPQQLSAPERTGFTVVEWGGSEIKK